MIFPGGVKFFTKMDARLGYHQVALDKASQLLTTFITPFGRYHYLRAPFGLSNIGECFNRKMEEHLCTYEHHESERRATDDILLFDRDFQAHLKHVREFLLRCRDANITIAPNKFDFGKSSVIFAGYKVSGLGYQPAHELVGALAKFPQPTSVTDLRSFLGLIGQFSEAAPELAKKVEPLREMLKKDQKFEWTGDHDVVMEEVKRYCLRVPILMFFDFKLPTRLVCDASRKGLGFCLQQLHGSHWRLVSCGSRFLTSAESNYAMIELELLAIVWAVVRCKMFLQGLPMFTLVTDHRPLVSILTKSRAPVDRIESQQEKLANCHADTEVDGNMVQQVNRLIVLNDGFSEGVSEMSMVGEDVLPKLCLKLGVNLRAKALLPFDVALQDLSMPRRLRNFKAQAEKSGDFIQLRDLIKEGFPSSKKQLTSSLTEYWKYRGNLTVIQGLVVFNLTKFFVPKSMRDAVLKASHLSHQGQKRFVLYLKQFYFWPGMSGDAYTWVNDCRFCQEKKSSNPVEGTKSWPPCTYPMERVFSDAGAVHGVSILVASCGFTGYLKAFRLVNLTARESRTHLSRFTHDYGMCEQLVTDGGTNYTGQDMQDWLDEWDIDHVTSTAGRLCPMVGQKMRSSR